MDNNIKENIDTIIYNINEAADKSGRKGSDITLVAVTKTIDVNTIKSAIDCGVTDVGENKAQEFTEKYEELNKYKEDLNFHFIGHLQTNKVKFIYNKVKLIHSVDSISVAAEINRLASNNNMIINILAQINIADEQSKFGINKKNAEEFVKNLSQFRNLALKGFMAIPPFVDSGEKNRYYFSAMYDLFVDINEKYSNIIDMDFLSMGMTNDYYTAIEEGSNIVRVGTGIFGDRI